MNNVLHEFNFVIEQLQYIKCNLCGMDKYIPVWEEDGLTIVRCRNCKLMYVNPRSETEANEDFFKDSFIKANYLHEKERILWETSRKTRHVKLLQKLETEGYKGKLLDIGCGLGYFLKTADERGWEVFG